MAKTLDDTLFGRVAALPQFSQDLLDVCHLWVAAAQPDLASHRQTSLRRALTKLGVEDPDELPSKLEEMVADIPKNWGERWFAPTVGLIPVYHPWFDIEEMMAGRLHRRIDAVLDWFDVEYCAHEAQAMFFEVVNELIEVAESDTRSFAKLAAHFGVGMAGGAAVAHGFLAAPVLVKRASDWIASQGMTKTIDTLDLARIYLLWQAVPGTGGNELSSAEKSFIARCQGEFRKINSSSTDPAIIRMWRGMLVGIGAGAHQGVPLPKVTELTLERAVRKVEDLGLEVTTFDLTGERREPWFTNNWIVQEQHPKAGTAIAMDKVYLGITKPGETSTLGARMRLTQMAAETQPRRNDGWFPQRRS